MTATTEQAAPGHVKPRLKERYQTEIAPALREEFGYANVMQNPRLTKITVNMGVGEAARDAKLIEGAVKNLAIITAKPAVAGRGSRSASSSCAGHADRRARELRGDRMWEFLDRVLTLALPRIRGFRGLNGRQFNGRGNYTSASPSK